MTLLVFALSIFFTILAAATLAYVSMMTMIGPWFAPTIVLIGGVITRKMYPNLPHHATEYSIAALQAIAAGGGTIAVGIGFALPMLYFLDPFLFLYLIEHPLLFITHLSCTILCAGAMGIFIGSKLAPLLIHKQELPFPSSKITLSLIQTHQGSHQNNLLYWGFLSTGTLCIMRDGIVGWFKNIIPQTLSLPLVPGHEISFSLSPMLVAIGFSAGHHIALPLVVGVTSKMLICGILDHRGFSSNSGLPNTMLGFCSGLVIAELAYSILIGNRISVQNIRSVASRLLTPYQKAYHLQLRSYWHGLLIFSISALFLWQAQFPLSAIILFLLLTCVATYYICVVSGHIGMVQFGRFSTFIMVPMSLLFSLSSLQITLICLFFHICAACASDYLFDYNIFFLGNYPKKNLVLYQIVGLVITALCLGVIFWLLFTTFQLGGPELFAQRGQTKALLLQSLNFDLFILVIGMSVGLLLKKLKISPTMTLGGILMPSSLVFSLLAGAFINFLIKDKGRYTPLCAGILTAESLWVIISILMKLI